VTRLVLRIWLPDRPGALGAVASRVGAVKADVVGIDVIERDGGVAIDELVVDLPDETLIDLMLAEIRQVDGVGVEEVHRDPAAPSDPGAASLDAARRVIEADASDALAEAVAEAGRALVGADWACVLTNPEPVLIGSSGASPLPSWLAAYRDGVRGPDIDGPAAPPRDPLCLPIPGSGCDLMVGRQSRPIRGRERDRLVGLAALAAVRWAQVARAADPSGSAVTQPPTGECAR
jgi:hypothetical protein